MILSAQSIQPSDPQETSLVVTPCSPHLLAVTAFASNSCTDAQRPSIGAEGAASDFGVGTALIVSGYVT